MILPEVTEENFTWWTKKMPVSAARLLQALQHCRASLGGRTESRKLGFAAGAATQTREDVETVCKTIQTDLQAARKSVDEVHSAAWAAKTVMHCHGWPIRQAGGGPALTDAILEVKGALTDVEMLCPEIERMLGTFTTDADFSRRLEECRRLASEAHAGLVDSERFLGPG